jgi:hypothetical protein
MNPQRQSFEAFALPMFHAFSTWGRDRDRSRTRLKQKQKQKKERKQEKELKKEHRCSSYLSLLNTAQKNRRVFASGSTHKNAALVMPKFGLTVEKRPGAAIEGGSTRIHLLANSELTQVKQNITSTARELRRGAKRKPGIRVSQGVALAAAKTFRVGGEGEGEPLPRQRGRILHKPTQSPIDPSQQTKSGENHA